MWSTPESEQQLLNIKLNIKGKKKAEERKGDLHENKLKRLGAKGAP